MEQLMDMGFSRELAAQALAATGGKSTLTATEWILSHRRMESINTTVGPSSRQQQPQGQWQQQQQQQQQQQGRLDQFFPSSTAAGRGEVTTEPGGTGQVEGGGNADWRNRQFVYGSPAEVKMENEATKRGGPCSTPGKVQEEDVGASRYRGAGNQGVPNQSLKEFHGRPFMPQLGGKVRSLDPTNEAVPSSTTMGMKHPHHGAQESNLTKRLRQGEPLERQQEMPAPVVPHSQSPLPLAVAPSGTPGTSGAAAPGMKTPLWSGKNQVPLAERMRPMSVDDIVGQDHLLGPRCILRSLLDNNSLSSIILWGPPGTGKTSLVRSIARSVSFRFVSLSAVSSGVKEVREILEESKRLQKFGQRTLLFLDEIHRFNKSQQDTFLPYVEAGHIVLIGATTENPSFEINAALLSRCRVLMLNKLQPDHIRKLLERAILDREKGVLLSIKGGSRGDSVRIEEDALQFLSHAADGDARVALNSLEIAGMAAFAAWESNLQRPQMDEWCSSTQCEAVQKTDMEREGLPEVSGLKREGSSSALVGMVTNTWVERSGSGFGIKRLEVLKESLRKDNLQNSPDDYTRPFKRFKGGKEVTAQIVVKDRESTSSSGGSGGETEKDTVGAPTTTLREIGGGVARELRDKDGNGMIGSENKGALGAVGTEAHGSNGSSSGAGNKEKKVIVVTLQLVKDALQRSHVLYDKTGDEHYNIISALHKSMRGGDADAAIYWLARMLEGGEGPLYVARRLVRFASEDIGLADPQALVLAVACYQACHFLGMPECNVNLAQCVVYLSLAQKSVIVYNAIVAAQRLVRESEQNEPVPLHLRNAPTQLMKDLGYSKGYIYPPNHVGPVEQEYLPPSLRGRKFLQWDKEGADH